MNMNNESFENKVIKNETNEKFSQSNFFCFENQIKGIMI